MEDALWDMSAGRNSANAMGRIDLLARFGDEGDVDGIIRRLP